ncbi:unnamed protein product [Urochloa humidicola]
MVRHLLGAGTAAFVAALVLLVQAADAQPFDYPSARPSTSWSNTDASLTHHVTFMDGSVARAALLRLNPAGFGPSYAFGFFCTNHQTSPCTDFLLGVAVVYCNSGALMTSVAPASRRSSGPPTAPAPSPTVPPPSSPHPATSSSRPPTA